MEVLDADVVASANVDKAHHARRSGGLEDAVDLGVAGARRVLDAHAHAHATGSEARLQEAHKLLHLQ